MTPYEYFQAFVFVQNRRETVVYMKAIAEDVEFEEVEQYQIVKNMNIFDRFKKWNKAKFDRMKQLQMDNLCSDFNVKEHKGNLFLCCRDVAFCEVPLGKCTGEIVDILNKAREAAIKYADR